MIDPSTERATSTDAAPMVVLLVDDQPFVGKVLKALLTQRPDIVLHQCTEASSAIARANELRPDVILQDLVMDVDGLIVVKDFRRNPSTASTPIVVLSANDDVESRTGAAGAGANDYMVKLPTSGALIDCLSRLTGRSTNTTFATTRQGVEPKQ